MGRLFSTSSTLLLMSLLLALRGIGRAQDTSKLPTCGQQCISQFSSTVDTATGNCNDRNAYCYCLRLDFAAKIQACASTSCTNATDQAVVDAWATGYCANAQTATGSGQGGRFGNRTTTVVVVTSTATGPAETSATAPVLATTATPLPKPVAANTLSTGIKVGITIGSVAVALFFSLLAFLLLRHYRHNRNSRHDKVHEKMARDSVHEVDGTGPPTEMEAKEMQYFSHPVGPPAGFAGTIGEGPGGGMGVNVYELPSPAHHAHQQVPSPMYQSPTQRSLKSHSRGVSEPEAEDTEMELRTLSLGSRPQTGVSEEERDIKGAGFGGRGGDGYGPFAGAK